MNNLYIVSKNIIVENGFDKYGIINFKVHVVAVSEEEAIRIFIKETATKIEKTIIGKFVVSIGDINCSKITNRQFIDKDDNIYTIEGMELIKHGDS